MKRILFRCDSSSQIGLGHVKRCLLLAKRLKKEDNNLKILFATLPTLGNINQEILKNGFSIYTLNGNTINDLDYLIKGLSIDFLIIDSYDINDFFEEQLKLMNPNLKILSFDDNFKPHKSDFILNHGIQAKKSDYKELVPKSSKVFCGSEYTLLRDEFMKRYKEKISKKSVAIILGGNDILNLSLKIAKYLLEIDNEYKITVITTSVNPHVNELKRNDNIELLIDIKNIAEVLSTKEFVITASGGTLFEVMALKKKFINIEVAENQKNITEYLENNSVNTTIMAENLSIKKLEKKIEYIKKKYLYRKLDLQFSKDKLVKKILKELK